MNSYFHEFFERAKREFLKHVRPHVLARVEGVRQPITREEYLAMMPLNSYERHLIYRQLDDDGLIELTRDCCRQSQYQPRGEWSLPECNYEALIISVLVPLLIQRLMSAHLLLLWLPAMRLMERQDTIAFIQSEILKFDDASKRFGDENFDAQSRCDAKASELRTLTAQLSRGLHCGAACRE